VCVTSEHSSPGSVSTWLVLYAASQSAGTDTPLESRAFATAAQGSVGRSAVTSVPNRSNETGTVALSGGLYLNVRDRTVLLGNYIKKPKSKGVPTTVADPCGYGGVLGCSYGLV